MNIQLDQVLKNLGVQDYSELTPDEKETYKGWLTVLSEKNYTVEDIRDHIRALIHAVELELADLPEFDYVFFGLVRRENRKHLFLKARLKNYILLEAFTKRPELAKKALEQNLTQIKSIV